MSNVLIYKGKMKEDMEREAGKPLSATEDAFVSLLEECMTIKEVSPSNKDSIILREITPLQDNEIITGNYYMDENIRIRLEALKLAYDFASKLKNFNISLLKEDDIDDIFKLANMNFEYLVRGNSSGALCS